MFLGNTRETLFDHADPNLMLVPVVVQFGKYMKIVDFNENLPVEVSQPKVRRVLDLKRQAQQSL